MAEFWRALRTLKVLQAEQAAIELQEAVPGPMLGARPRLAHPLQPNEPERTPRRDYLPIAPPASGALHEPAVPWLPNEPESVLHVASVPGSRTNPKPHPSSTRPSWRRICRAA
jgi:hypothetical protein